MCETIDPQGNGIKSILQKDPEDLRKKLTGSADYYNDEEGGEKRGKKETPSEP